LDCGSPLPLSPSQPAGAPKRQSRHFPSPALPTLQPSKFIPPLDCGSPLPLSPSQPAGAPMRRSRHFSFPVLYSPSTFKVQSSASTLPPRRGTCQVPHIPPSPAPQATACFRTAGVIPSFPPRPLTPSSSHSPPRSDGFQPSRSPLCTPAFRRLPLSPSPSPPLCASSSSAPLRAHLRLPRRLRIGFLHPGRASTGSAPFSYSATPTRRMWSSSAGCVMEDTSERSIS
jgi:hypothetical protein